MSKYFNYKVDDIQVDIVNRDGWGSYIVIDNFLNKDVFDTLCSEFNHWKVEDNSIYTNVEGCRCWREGELPGAHPIIGGAGSTMEGFEKLCSLSSNWKDFLSFIYSDESYKYFMDIFSDTDVYKKNVMDRDITDGTIGCKISSQLNNYGDIIHPDNYQKLVSYLLYMDTYGWEEDSQGGTDLWEVLDDNVEYDKNVYSMDYKMRNGRNSTQKERIKLTHDEAERIKKFKSIDFKPNRLIGFVRNDKSYHSIPPRVLPEGITRDCFQINVWNLNREKE